MNLIQYTYLCIILCMGNLFARSTIKGTIRDSNTNEPLIGANIMLMDTNFGIASDADGFYMISNIPMGRYFLNAMFIGYENMEKEIFIDANQEYVIDISLKASSIKLQETKVTAEKRKEKVTSAPASMEIVTSRDIKAKNTTNMGAYLKGLKGVDFTSSGINNYSISVRGFNSSFSTRLLTLSDGRVANIPALRVINYSTIPQSMDDVDKIEVVLGPATALYGANAHSGVVNVVSKPPSQSEGFTMSVSGSTDEREFRKINGRFSKKLSNMLSMKISGLYLHAYDWEYISEEEYKSHLYPWTLTPARTNDGKDNNPWDAAGGSLTWQTTNDGREVRIGNGEPNHGDLDGDGVAGEDWYNGYDDDGDGLIDEDYFTANGIDDDGDGWIDEDIDYITDLAYDGVDNDRNGTIDDEPGGNYIDATLKDWGANIDNNILIQSGRRDSLINPEPYTDIINFGSYDADPFCQNPIYDSQEMCENENFTWYSHEPYKDQDGNGNWDGGEINPYYVPNLTWEHNDLHGEYRFNEQEVKLEFDIYTYDYGDDGIPGDPFTDMTGDNILQTGECLSGFSFIPYGSCDNGLDGDPNTGDHGEQDGIWQPGDGWIDNGDGVVDFGTLFNPEDSYETPGEEDKNVWPPANGIWDEGEPIFDYGQDGLENTGDAGEDGQLIAWDNGEKDGRLDIGDGLFGFMGEPFSDFGADKVPNTGDAGENDTIRNFNESYSDVNNDGQYNAPDMLDDYQMVLDNNGDGLNDYPDFEIDNKKIEFRLDFDPNPNFNMTYQSGYSYSKTQQVTGTGRYIADGFEYVFHQLRGRYKNWFTQFYVNQSFSGDTRGYNLGNRILDESKNYAYQLQHNFKTPQLNTKFVWGLDYFRTEPKTFGTILNDGPNGYDNDGDNVIIGYNGVDDDGDGTADDLICPDGGTAGFKDGQLWICGEGIDEPDEFVDPTSNEYGLYYQSTTELFGTSRFEFITAARLDKHDLLDEGIQFAPKLGFIYKPDSKSSMRITYGKAYNTPNSISLFTDLFIGSRGFFNVYLRGNYTGTDYCRVGQPCLGEDYPTSVSAPGFYSENGDEFYTMGPSSNITYFNDYEDRVNGAPYYFKFGGNDLLVGDNIPLDTMTSVIYVPSLTGDGVLYSAEESMSIPNVDAIKTEKIQTIEFGYKGFLGRKTHFSLDYYLSYYEDFFSPPTIITPLVVSRVLDQNGNDITDIDNLNVQGIMTINDVATYPPYATAFNGIDDDGDWSTWASEFGWDTDDKDGDCLPNAPLNDPCWADPCEWGFIVNGETYHPWEVLENESGYPGYQDSGVGSQIYQLHGAYATAGVDEWHETSQLNEHEIVEGATSPDGDLIPGIGVTAAPYHLVLSPMNYGEVWMQGLDFGITHFITDKLIIDGNISWYGTTEFYNELTRENDPINAPEWKWNASIKWGSSLGSFILNFRHVDKFKWSDGIWAGDIGPYNILDLFYTYNITKNLDFNISALNVNNDRHKELIGGAIMGRQVVMRFTSTF